MGTTDIRRRHGLSHQYMQQYTGEQCRVFGAFSFRVYAKRTLGSATLTYPDGYLTARGYSNGIWSAIAGPSRASEITVNASAGYSTFSVRCYQSQADASAWNDSFIAEISVGVSYDGASGRDASEPRPRGFSPKATHMSGMKITMTSYWPHSTIEPFRFGYGLTVRRSLSHLPR